MLDYQKRTLAVDAVLDKLQRISLLLEANSGGNADFIVNAGFQCIEGAGGHRAVLLEVPTITSLKSTPVPGQIQVIPAECRGARSFAFEFSYDKGAVWHNGAYSSKLRNKFAVDTNDTVYVRAKAIGSSNLVSEFCAPVSCQVL